MRVLLFALAKAKQLLPSVVLLGHVVDGDHMRADAHVLEALAAADEAAGVGLALHRAILLQRWAEEGKPKVKSGKEQKQKPAAAPARSSGRRKQKEEEEKKEEEEEEEWD